MKKKKIVAITGIRSEYYILKPLLEELRKHPDEFTLKLVVSGAHLSDWHGYTLRAIEEDGFEIADRIDYLLMTNRDVQRSKGVGILTYAFAQTVERENPDFLVVVGDREEPLAAAIVANYQKKLLVHIGGGDPVYGNADDPVRFAVSKLAHVHLVNSEVYAQNLRNVGEEDFRIFVIGNLANSLIHSTPWLEITAVAEALNFDITSGDYIVFIKHPLSSEKEEAYQQMKIALEAVKEFCDRHHFKVVGIYPNTDPGSYDILKAIEEIQSDSIKFFKTIPQRVFVNLIRHAKALAGNSSMGILEAPFYRKPVVNIGHRQQGRLNAGNVEFVEYQVPRIVQALERACFDTQYRQRVEALSNPYGDHTAAQRAVQILQEIDPRDTKWYVKKKLC